MKPTAVLLLVLLAYLQATEHYWSSEELECLRQLKLKGDKIGPISEPWGKPISINNRPLNDFFVCYWKSIGMLGNDGNIKWRRFKKYITDEFINMTAKEETNSKEKVNPNMAAYVGQIVKDSMDKCHKQNIRGNSPGQTIAKVLNCLGEETRAKFKKN